MTSTSSSKKPSAAETAKQIKELLKEISDDDRANAARLDHLRRVFAGLVAVGDLTFGSSDDSTLAKWNKFLQKHHATMVSQICSHIEQGERSAVRTMWGVIAASPCQQQHVNPDLLYRWLEAMLHLDYDKTLRHMVEQEFLHVYRDVQYYSLGAIARIAKTNSIEKEQQERLMQLLLMVPMPHTQKEMDDSKYLFRTINATTQEEPNESDADSEEEDSDTDASDQDVDDDKSVDEKDDTKKGTTKRDKRRLRSVQRLSCHTKAHSNAWLAVLKLELPTRALKHALQHLPGHVLPHVPNPLLFSDFFMGAYSVGGFTSLLALDGLFGLMTEHGLEHANFYSSLYRLVQPRSFYAKHRARFLQLLTKSLVKNSMLPFHIVAAFIKRILRTSLVVPPSGALFCLALVSNLLRQFPACTCMIHRDSDKAEDVFDAATNNPAKSRALESSLWELGALSKHYYFAVATLAKAVGTENDKTPLYDLDDFLSHTYQTLWEQERKRGEKKRKQKTPLTFVEPKRLFTDTDVFSNILAMEE